MAQLRQLFRVADEEMPRLCGHMARLCAFDIFGTLQPRMAFLQALTGRQQQDTAMQAWSASCSEPAADLCRFA